MAGTVVRWCGCDHPQMEHLMMAAHCKMCFCPRFDVMKFRSETERCFCSHTSSMHNRHHGKGERTYPCSQCECQKWRPAPLGEVVVATLV